MRKKLNHDICLLHFPNFRSINSSVKSSPELKISDRWNAAPVSSFLEHPFCMSVAVLTPSTIWRLQRNQKRFAVNLNEASAIGLKISSHTSIKRSRASRMSGNRARNRSSLSLVQNFKQVLKTAVEIVFCSLPFLSPSIRRALFVQMSDDLRKFSGKSPGRANAREKLAHR